MRRKTSFRLLTRGARPPPSGSAAAHVSVGCDPGAHEPKVEGSGGAGVGAGVGEGVAVGAAGGMLQVTLIPFWQPLKVSAP